MPYAYDRAVFNVLFKRFDVNGLDTLTTRKRATREGDGSSRDAYRPALNSRMHRACRSLTLNVGVGTVANPMPTLIGMVPGKRKHIKRLL